MAAEQQHGNTFESLVIHQSQMFPKMAGITQPANALYDIPARFTDDNIPVSIKTSKYPEKHGAPTLYLADAARFYQITTTGPLRLISGFYESTPERLIFHQIMEVILTPVIAPLLWGNLEEADIRSFSTFIKEEKSKIGDDPNKIQQLQRTASAYKTQFSGENGIISLNPKVAQNVGRLQCSVDAGALWTLAQEHNLTCAAYDHKPYGALPLPIALEHGGRTSKHA